MHGSTRADCAVGTKYYLAVGGSAQILIVIRKAFVAHVNARNSNHDPNHVLDRDQKRLSERDSSPCEHSQWLIPSQNLSAILRMSGM